MIVWGKLLTYSRDMIDGSCMDQTKLGEIRKSTTEGRDLGEFD
jgi:hypothetical protein